MAQAKILTLLSDFGDRDVYVAVMKGAIAQINPALTVIDLTHHIPAQNVAQARLALMTAFPYFPRGTVHVAVVDPGVGGDRRGVAIAVGNGVDPAIGFLVGPDNGLFSGVLSQYSSIAGVELSNPVYWRTSQPSHTFHGRDIFAAVGAHLASGTPLAALGATIAPATLVTLDLPTPTRQGDYIFGCIQAVDRFGNLITNIPAAAVAECAWTAVSNERHLDAVLTYSDRPIGEPIALIGSHGWVELAVNSGSAQATLSLNVGDAVKIVLHNSC